MSDYTHPYSQAPFSRKNKRYKKTFLIVALIVIVIVCVFLFTSLQHVPTNHIAVEVKASQITGNTFSAGWYIRSPLVSFRTFSLESQTLSLQTIQGELKGGEIVTLDISLKYHVDEDKVILLYQKGGTNYLNKIMPVEEISDIIKSIVATYNIDVFPSSRVEIMEIVRDKLNERFADYGIVIESAFLSNYNYDDAVEQAISELAVRRLEQQQQEVSNDIKIAQAEAEATILSKQATAEAEAEISKAEGEAEALTIKAAAQAQANQLLADSLTPNLILYSAIEKWDSSLPAIIGGSTTGVLDLSKFLDNEE